MIVGDDGSVTVLLPPASLDDARVDHEASTVLDRDRGVLDRVGGLFSDSPTSERGLYLEAETRLAEAAADSELLADGAGQHRGDDQASCSPARASIASGSSSERLGASGPETPTGLPRLPAGRRGYGWTRAAPSKEPHP